MWPRRRPRSLPRKPIPPRPKPASRRRTTPSRPQQATLERYNNELERAKTSLDRYEQMYKEKLVAKQDYDQKKADYDSAVASVRENEARLAQMKVAAGADRGAT